VIALPRAVRIWVHREPVDMRKSFDTLASLVRAAFGVEVLAGGVFVFVGRRRRTANRLQSSRA
jgi:transposase